MSTKKYPTKSSALLLTRSNSPVKCVHQIRGGPQSAQQDPNKIHKEIRGFINKSVLKVLTRSGIRSSREKFSRCSDSPRRPTLDRMFADLQQVPSVGPAGNSPERTFQRLTRFEQRMCAAGITSFAQVPIDTHHASIPDDRNHLCCNHLRQSATAIDIHSVQCRHSRRSTRRSFCQWDHSCSSK